MKLCFRCRVDKPTSAFGVLRSKPDGLRSECIECRRQRDTEWFRRNRDRESAKKKRYIQQNAAQHRERLRRWHAKNRAKVNAIQRDFKRRKFEMDPEAFRLAKRQQQARRRARLRGAAVGPIDYDRIQRRDRMRCHICRNKVDRTELQFDHVIPLAAGGTHTEENIAVSHRSCNQRKSAAVLTLF